MGLRSYLSPDKSNNISNTSSVPQVLPIRVNQPAPPQVIDEDYDDAYEDEDEYTEGEANMKIAEFDMWGANDGGGPAWWQIPASVGIGVAGLGAGWSGIDALLNAKRKNDTDNSLEQAKEDYEEALTDQYQSSKVAEDSSLDALFDEMEKQAGIVDTIKNFLHGGAGAYATALGTATLGSGYAGYQWAKSRSKNKMLEKALRRRARERAQPQPVYAKPEYIATPEYGEFDEEELE